MRRVAMGIEAGNVIRWMLCIVQEDGVPMLATRDFVWLTAKHDEEQPATADSKYEA